MLGGGPIGCELSQCFARLGSAVSQVEMLPQVKEAFDAYAQAGFIAGRYDYELGGMQLPESVMAACNGFFTAANPGTAGYPFLTTAAANLIRVFGNEQQKTTFLPNMLSGRFSGTMALTEPHAGSSLADIRTSASPTDEGHYLIEGAKIYISGGEQSITDNIVHMVLAKIKGAPAGVKGISLFIVPKFLVDDEGNPTERNGVSLAGLIHKLGYRGTTSTALSFGDDAPCHGYLVGEPHQGLKYMFQMMNEARVGVGFGAAVIGYRGYMHSLEYAKDRLQGRKASEKNPESPQVPIIDHADVRRMLLAQKAYSEGGLALCLYGARLMDDQHTHPDEQKRQEAGKLLDLLTPVIKAWPSEYGPKANDLAIQELKKSIEQDPQDATAHFYLGRVFQQKEQYEESLIYFQTVLSLDPDLEQIALFQIGLAYSKIEEKEDAKLALGMALEKDPESATAAEIENLLNELGVKTGKSKKN